MLGFTGVTDIDCKKGIAAVTPKVVLPEMSSNVALITALPAETPEANPVELTVATEVAEDDQVTLFSNCDVPSE